MKRIAVVCTFLGLAASSLGGCAMSAQDGASVGTVEQALGMNQRPIHAVKRVNGVVLVDSWDEPTIWNLAYSWRFPRHIYDAISTGQSNGPVYVDFEGNEQYVGPTWVTDMRQPTEFYDRDGVHKATIQLVDVPSPENPQWRVHAGGVNRGVYGEVYVEYSGHY